MLLESDRGRVTLVTVPPSLESGFGGDPEHIVGIGSLIENLVV